MTSPPKAIADVRQTFQKQLTKLQETTRDSAKADHGEVQRPWFLPDKLEWDGDLFKLEEISKAFDRKENHEDFLKSITSNPPGVVGDLIVSQLQGDWLAAMERAFRARHMSRCRSSQHAAARRFGHGHESGLFKKSVLGFVQGIVQNSKNQPRTDS